MKHFSLLILLVAGLFALCLFKGSIPIPASYVWRILFTDGEGVRPSWVYIVMESRLPSALTAVLSGASLAVSGLMLQTAFRNPLADPAIFGINSGAGVGVALVMLLLGGSLSTGSLELSGSLAVVAAAFVGAMAVMGSILALSRVVHSGVMLLIVGIMIGYVSSSVVALLNFFATDEGVKSYMVWGMGTFGGVPMRQMPLLAVLTLLPLAGSLTLAKPLNALLLGERYAQNLGIRTRRVRTALLLVTGLLTAVTTAFCGPVAFIGLAVPHVARMVFTTADHRRLLPLVMLTGAATALLCSLLCHLPGERGVIPLGAVTPLLGAPVIVYVILRRVRNE